MSHPVQRRHVGPRDGDRRKVSADRRREIVAAYASGRSARQLHEEYGHSTFAILSWAREAGCEIRPSGRQPAGEVWTLETHLKENFLTNTEAARAIGIDRTSLAEALRRGSVPGAFQWGGIWFVPKAGLNEYRTRRRSNGES